MILTNPLQTQGLALSLDATPPAFQAWGHDYNLFEPPPDKHARCWPAPACCAKLTVVKMKRPGRLPARGAVASAFLRIENPRAAPSIPPSQQARYLPGISPVSPRYCSHVDGINMGAIP